MAHDSVPSVSRMFYSAALRSPIVPQTWMLAVADIQDDIQILIVAVSQTVRAATSHD